MSCCCSVISVINNWCCIYLESLLIPIIYMLYLLKYYCDVEHIKLFIRLLIYVIFFWIFLLNHVNPIICMSFVLNHYYGVTMHATNITIFMLHFIWTQYIFHLPESTVIILTFFPLFLYYFLLLLCE